MKTLSRIRRGFTLAEVMVAAAVMSIVLGAVTAGVFCLQRSFAASQDFITAHQEQVRAMDTIKRDSRSATAAEIRAGGTSIVFTTTTTSPGLLNLQLPSTLLGLLLPSGSSAPTTETITYSFTGNRLTRTKGAEVSVVTTRQTRFQVVQTGSHIKATMAFQARYSRHPVETPATTMTCELGYWTNTW